ncbi:MAG: PKD domain-containing protein [Sphingobacteriales bacterium JAD_PAG50586_3]|nr:MAG: PKD domain-containing protein [Sphingobacteriales bacterium JAD_PAG50586_3]
MKKTFTHLLILLSIPVFLLSACKKKPAACISTDTIQASVNEPITFSSCSDNADRLEWNMGDGNTFTYYTVAYAYTTPGTYIVTLTVFNDNDENSDEVTKEIIIVP